MREKRMMLGISLLLLVLTGVSFLFFPAEEPSMSRMLLESQEELLGTLEDTEEELLTKLLFAGEELPCDRETGTFYLPVDMDSKEWEAGE